MKFAVLLKGIVTWCGEIPGSFAIPVTYCRTLAYGQKMPQAREVSQVKI